VLYFYDKEVGLYNLNARFFDAKIARFMQADTYTGSRSDPLSLNLYTYCVNNPIKYRDPTGHTVAEDNIKSAFEAWQGGYISYDTYINNVAQNGGTPYGTQVSVSTSNGTQTGYVVNGRTYMESDGARPNNGDIVVMPSGAAYQMDSSLGYGVRVDPPPATGSSAASGGSSNSTSPPSSGMTSQPPDPQPNPAPDIKTPIITPLKSTSAVEVWINGIEIQNSIVINNNVWSNVWGNAREIAESLGLKYNDYYNGVNCNGTLMYAAEIYGDYMFNVRDMLYLTNLDDCTSC